MVVSLLIQSANPALWWVPACTVQVDKGRALGMNVGVFNSNEGWYQKKQTLDDIRSPCTSLKLLYTTPESLYRCNTGLLGALQVGDGQGHARFHAILHKVVSLITGRADYSWWGALCGNQEEDDDWGLRMQWQGSVQ